MNFKRKEYRNKKWVKLCHDTSGCLVQSPYCENGPTVPCHSNTHDDGKGGKIKADDCFIAKGCNACHDFLDRRGSNWKNHSPEEIQWYHDRGIKRTLRLALDEGIIR